ncbi:MAG: hypothetical protein JNK72_07440 [Myxococcales bacterium]|nr:hypothetical protein [Myxococcales bacterium]
MNTFDQAVCALREALDGWNRGAVPGLISRAAVLFDEAARDPEPRTRAVARVGAAVSRGFAGDPELARRRLLEAISETPDLAAGYVALGMLCLRDPHPLDHAQTAVWALLAARDLAPGVPCIERMLPPAFTAAGEFMSALQSARSAMQLDHDDDESRLWAAMLRLYFGGDLSATAVLCNEVPELAMAYGKSSAAWLGAVAGHYARAEFHEARVSLRKAIAPLKIGDAQDAPWVDGARRWYRELKGFGPGVAMSGDRWLRDVGGSQSEYARTRAALSAFREQVSLRPERAAAEGVEVLAVEGLVGELEARTRRGILEWGARLILRGFAEAYLPLVAWLEAPPMDVLAAMDLLVLDG